MGDHHYYCYYHYYYCYYYYYYYYYYYHYFIDSGIGSSGKYYNFYITFTNVIFIIIRAQIVAYPREG